MKKIILSLVAIFISTIFLNAQIQITSAADFAKIGVDESFPIDGNYIQTQDFTYPNTLTASIISSFSGTYNGNGKKITYNAVYPDNQYANYGLFASNSGEIKNLNIESTVHVTGFATSVGMLCGENNGTITNCNVISGSIYSSDNAGAYYTGMIVGKSNSGAIVKRCAVSGSCEGALYTGGVVGFSAGEIKACEFVGDITSNGYSVYMYPPGAYFYQAFIGGVTAYGNVYSSYAEPIIHTPAMTMNQSGYFGITPSTAIGCAVGENAKIDNRYISTTTTETTIAAIAGTFIWQGNISCFITPLSQSEITSLNNYASTNNAIGIDWSIYAEVETANPTYTVSMSGVWSASSTWGGGFVPTNLHTTNLPTGGVDINIPAGKTVKLNTTLVLSNNIRLNNSGTLIIVDGGDLVNTTSVNNLGNVKIEKSINANRWYLTAAPFTNYTMNVVEIPSSGTNHDVAAIKYDYSTGAWSDNYMTLTDNVSAGESFFMWPFYSGSVNFVPNGCSVNNSDFSLTRAVTSYTDGGYWMALANPYPGKMDIADFIATSGLSIQGVRIYGFDASGGYFNTKSSGEIKVTEGFFVNVGSTGNKTVQYKKQQMKNYPSSQNKSLNQPREFIDFAVEYDFKSIGVQFAQNDEAEQAYDIFDANKLFATTGVIEPYFLTDGISLVAEEVKELPYYATLNIRSYETDTVKLVAKNVPEGYAVSLIDGEQTIDMVEGDMYEVVLEEGENAGRFKLLVKKSLSIADVEESEFAIINDNRHINILSQEKMDVEVYNALGQKVYQTNERNFVLNNVPAGAYVVKAKTGNSIETAKIIIK